MKNIFKHLMIGDGFKMNPLVHQFSMAAVTVAIMQVASAQTSITQIVPMVIPNQGTEIRVSFNGIPPQPQAYQLDQPSRLILDFDNASTSLQQGTIQIGTPEANNVDLATDPQRSRLTINLKDAGGFTTRTEGNTFILKINNSGVSSSAIMPAVTKAQAKTGLENIGFQRGSQGEGQVQIDLLSAATPVDVQQQGSRVVIRLLGSKVPAHLARRLNVNDFATPVSNIDAYNDGNNGVIVIQSTGSYEYMAYQAEDKLTVSLKRPAENIAKPRAAQTYTGKKISLDFQDIEVRRVLQLLADFTGINMVASDTVQGNITLRVQDVPWDQALDIILKTKALDKRRNGNVIWIAPLSELIKAEEEEAKALAQSIRLAPIQTEYIQLNYAKAEEVLKLITDGKNSNSGGQSSGSGSQNNEMSGSLLSPRGSVSHDPRTNTLIVNDTATKIDEIRKMIDLVDVAVKQVMIEARIVRASTNFSKEIGVKWGVVSQGIPRNNDLLVGGSDQTLWDLKTPDDDGVVTITRPQNLNVDLGVSGAAGKIAFGLINMSDFMLDLELSALQADGYGEVISTPKVMTADKQTAKVATGQEVPYQTTTNSAAGSTATTSFKEALLSLEVTPSITPDGKINMELAIAKDSIAGEAPNGELILNKNEINTNVLVNNGETVVLGGVFEQTTYTGVTKVPFFGDLPVIGKAFRKDTKSDDKNELLIFVTPRIVNDSNIRNH